MSQEMTLSLSIFATKRNTVSPFQTLFQWNPQPNVARIDIAGSSGPYVGTVIAQLNETIINLTSMQITSGGWAYFQNQDVSNSVYVGLFVQEINRFVSFALLLPGEFFAMRLSDHIGVSQIPGTGTGSSGDANPVFLALKASVAPVSVKVDVMPP